MSQTYCLTAVEEVVVPIVAVLENSAFFAIERLGGRAGGNLLCRPPIDGRQSSQSCFNLLRIRHRLRLDSTAYCVDFPEASFFVLEKMLAIVEPSYIGYRRSG